MTVMDIDVPVMGGLEVTRRLIRKNPAAKILTLTQHDTREHIPSAINAGAAGYVLYPKGALGSELISAI